MRHRAITVPALALLLAGTLDPVILGAQGSAAPPARRSAVTRRVS